jgi:PKD repeat protein
MLYVAIHMKKSVLPILLCVFWGVLGVYLFQIELKPHKHTKVPKRDRIDLAWAQENEMTKDPETGGVPKERLFVAYEMLQKAQRGFNKAAIAGVTWAERGPNNNGGRTRAILVDLNDVTHQTIWAGSVAGGLWKTTNITAAQPNWASVNDFFSNMAITSITQAPTNPQVLYFATGEGNNNSDAVRGMGVWKSSDGGITWAQLSATNTSDFHYNQKVFTLSNGDTVFVCSKNGLFRSVNAGTSFTKVLGSGIATAGGNIAHDIERMNNGTLYASMSSGSNGGGTIHKSYNKGATWTTPLSVSIAIDEVELAVANNDTSIVYGLVENNSTIPAIIKSTNAGVAFAATSAYPVDADGGITATDFSRTQAWYDLSICVNPLNANVVYVGGIDLFKTSNGGSSWQQVSHWYGGFSFQEVHADQHIAMYDITDTSIAYFGNDGGVYRTSNAGATIPTITSKEINYNTAQFYACDIHPSALTNYFLAGAQDNGSHRFNTTGINSTTEVTGGDGAFCHIDQTQPAYQYTSYVYNNYYRSTNSGASFSSSGLSFGNTGRFINPTDYDDSLNVLYAAHNAGSFLKWTNPQTGSTNVTVSVTAFNGGTISAVTVSPSVLGRVYFGTGSGRIAYVDNANTVTTSTAGVSMGTPSSNYVSCIAVDPTNENHVLVTYSNYGVTSVWETLNAGSTWTSIEGNLPDMPVRWVIFNPVNNTQALIATELGVWSTDLINGSSTNWQPTNTGLANVRCDMLKVRSSDKMVIVATHGRGLYSTNSFALPMASFTSVSEMGYAHNTIQFTNASSSATSYVWNFGDGTSSVLVNPSKTYTAAGNYTVTLSINGGISSATKTIKILPAYGVPYTPANGGNFETNISDFYAVLETGTGFELGNSAIAGKSGVNSGSNAWVTGLTATNYLDNTAAYLYTPSFNFTALGTYTIRFYAKNIFELNYDGYILQYSINNGLTWLPLGTTTATNWYDYANTSTNRPFVQNQAFFNATKSTYTLRSYATSALQGNSSVAFRFVFKSDGSQTAAGLAIDDFEIVGPTNAALPVSLFSFRGKRTNPEMVELQWQTASEKNADRFEVERTLDWNAPFETVGTVAAFGNTLLQQRYLFTNANAHPYHSFYRLKMIDKDGKFEYSNSISIAGYNKHTTQLVQAFIPTSNNSKQFLISNSLYSTLAYTIINTQGQIVKKGEWQQGDLLDLTELPTGIYYCRLVAATGQTQTEKVLVK